jgi:Tfp pilus assembly protein PilX/cytoskeletal protein CcmA (bactofilin family)
MSIRSRLQDERGVAMVVALLVSFVVLILGVAVVSLSLHNLEASGYDRRRLLSIGAAEAGLDSYYETIERTPPTSLPCTLSGTVSSGPNTATYEASIKVYNAAGAEIACPPSGTSAVGALITSTGQAGTNAPRTMQSYVRLTPIYGGWEAAIFANTPTTIGQRMTLNSASGTDGDIYVNGDLTLNNHMTISGSLYVAPAGVSTGSLSLSNQVNVQADVWANGTVTMSNGATVAGDVTSSTGNISVSNPATIQGNATAAGTVGSSSQISGLITPGYTQDPPPGQTLPQITFSAAEQAEWTNAGYVTVPFVGIGNTPCTLAKTFIANVASGIEPAQNYVVRIISSSGTPCKLSIGGSNTTTNVVGNLAIITDGAIELAQKNVWKAVGGDRKLFFISRYRTGLSCAAGDYNVTTSNNTDFLNTAGADLLDVFFYSPCTVSLANQNAFRGQVFGQTVNITNQINMTFVPTVVPGVTQIVGYRQDPAYVREVRS